MPGTLWRLGAHGSDWQALSANVEDHWRGAVSRSVRHSFGIFAGLLPSGRAPIFWIMAKIDEVQKLALELPETQRALLAAHLLGSLPPVLHDEDEGIAEALRRDAELDTNPATGIGLEELDRQIQRRPG